MGNTDLLQATSASVKKEGKWNVDTSYIDFRTADLDRIESRCAGTAVQLEEIVLNSALNRPILIPSGTAKKEADGKWKVDTSYIGFRSGDLDNIIRNEGEKKGSKNFIDPAKKK